MGPDWVASCRPLCVPLGQRGTRANTVQSPGCSEALPPRGASALAAPLLWPREGTQGSGGQYTQALSGPTSHDSPGRLATSLSPPVTEEKPRCGKAGDLVGGSRVALSPRSAAPPGSPGRCGEGQGLRAGARHQTEGPPQPLAPNEGLGQASPFSPALNACPTRRFQSWRPRADGHLRPHPSNQHRRLELRPQEQSTPGRLKIPGGRPAGKGGRAGPPPRCAHPAEARRGLHSEKNILDRGVFCLFSF